MSATTAGANVAKFRIRNVAAETWSVLGTCIIAAIGTLIAVREIQMVAIVALLSGSLIFIAFNTHRALRLAAGQVELVAAETAKNDSLRTEMEAQAGQLEAAREEYRQLELHFGDSDRAFRQMATHRMMLDTHFFLLMRKPKVERSRAMSEAITGYFEQVCDHVVDIISARMMIDKDDLAVDIKIVSDNGMRYRAVARSTPHSLDARERMARRSQKDKDKRDLVSNLHLKYAKESTRHEHVIDNLVEWRKPIAHKYPPHGFITAPPESASEFYRTSLTVAMYIVESEEDSELIGDYGREANVNYDKERVYGFISVDSLRDIVFTDREKSIMHEIASNTLSVIRLYDLLGDISKSLLK